MVAGERADDPNQERIEREERHVRSLVALGRDVEVVHGVPAPPHREQQVRSTLGRACPARWPMMTAASSAMTMMAARVATKSIKHFAHGLVEARRDEDFERRRRAPRRRRRCRAPCVSCGRQDERQPQQQERHPRERVVLQRARERDAGAARKVARVAEPQRRARRRRRRASAPSSPSCAQRRVVARNDERVPGKEAEGQAGQHDGRATASQPGASSSSRQDRSESRRLWQASSGGHGETSV